jgi:hypothetical protein
MSTTSVGSDELVASQNAAVLGMLTLSYQVLARFDSPCIWSGYLVLNGAAAQLLWVVHSL